MKDLLRIHLTDDSNERRSMSVSNTTSAVQAGETFAERLCALRAELKLTQSQAAERIGTGLRHYQAWEYGERKPKKMFQEFLMKKLKGEA